MHIIERISHLEPLPQNHELISFVTSEPEQRITSLYYFDSESGSFYAK